MKNYKILLNRNASGFRSPQMGIHCLFVFLMTISCNNENVNTFKQSIPNNRPFYLFMQSTSDSLGLNRIDKGFDSIEIRISFTYSNSLAGKMVVIRNLDSKKWTSLIYTYTPLLNDSGNKITRYHKSKILLRPKNGYNKIIADLKKSNFFSLPGEDTDKSYLNESHHPNLMTVEFATKDEYKFYKYPIPFLGLKGRSNFDVKKIADLIKSEFDLGE
jgi:hypothetical protein